MSRRAWMPLYVGDYLGDTGHLSTLEHGAYLLLMMHYWRQGELPNDDRQLAAITKLSITKWLQHKPVFQAFFFEGWRHKRIDEELAKMEKATNKRVAAGQKGGLRSAMNRMLLEDAATRSNAAAKLKHGVATATLDHSYSHKNNTSTEYVERGLSEGKPPRLSGNSSPDELASRLTKGNA